MSDTIKQAGIKQADGTYLMKDIGVDYTNVDGLSTAAKSFEAFSADKATADKNNKDITEYVASISKNGENISVQSGDPTATPVDVDLSMTGATAVDNGEAGFVPQPTVADNAKFLRGDGTWAIPQDITYTGSDNIEIDGTTNAIDLTDSTVSSGTYGPSADVTGSNGVTISVPKFTVDAKGRLTSAGTQTYTSVDTTYSAGTGLSLSGTSFRLGSHASTGTGYGQGSGSNFGHVKLSDTYASLVSGADAAGGVAASQNALYNAYNTLAQTTDSIQNQIVPTASIEMGETASKAYNIGDFLVKDGILYKVTNAIAEGDALTVGTNIVITTVGGELSSIKSNVNDDIDRVTQDGVVLTSPYTCTRKRECIRVEATIGYTEGKNSGAQIFVNGHLAVSHTGAYGSGWALQTLIYLYEGDVLTFKKIGSGRANAWRVSDD